MARFGAEKGIAGTERQAVGLTHDGADHQPHVEVEVLHQPADDLDLLKILLSEVGDLRLHEVEQFQDNRGDTAEMAGPIAAFKGLGELARLDKGVEPRGIDILRFGSKDHVHVKVVEGRGVLLEISGVMGKILARAELYRIDKDGNHHGVALLLGPADKALVTLMQSAHRRYQSQRPAAGAQFAQVALQFRNRGDQPGVHIKTVARWPVASG